MGQKTQIWFCYITDDFATAALQNGDYTTQLRWHILFQDRSMITDESNKLSHVFLLFSEMLRRKSLQHVSTGQRSVLRCSRCKIYRYVAGPESCVNGHL